jgi:hypothetical protein
MTKLITAFTLFVITFISAQGQQSVLQRAQDNLNKEWEKHLGFGNKEKSEASFIRKNCRC